MRKHLYLITEHRDESRVGKIEFAESRHEHIGKNEEGGVDMRNMNTNETWSYKAVGLGYHDFEDEKDYHERIGDVATEKLREVDEKHLEKASIELAEN